MQEDAIQRVRSEFDEWATRVELFGRYSLIKTKLLEAPHDPSGLPKGWQGVYAFRYQDVWLKVGKAGPKSGARWLSHHYGMGRSESNLSWSLLRYAHYADREDPRLSPTLKARLRAIDPSNIGEWIKRNTDRLNMLLAAKAGSRALAKLEGIAIDILDPVFEGPWKFGGPSP